MGVSRRAMPLNVGGEGYDNLQSHNASLMESSDLEAPDLEFRCDGGDQTARPVDLGKGDSLVATGTWQPSHPDKAKKMVFWLMSVSVCVEMVLLYYIPSTSPAHPPQPLLPEQQQLA